MRTHFNEDFRLLVPSDFSAYRRIAREENMWRSHDQVICSMDSVKPLQSRRGWSAKQVAEYNQERFEDLISAGWDLVVVDEAHRLGGSTDQVARYKLGQGLSEAAPYFILLSATPHQGKTDAFHRLVSLIDAQAFPDVGSVTRDRVQPYVIRTEKRRAITAEGKPLFKPRKTELAPVSWGETHQDQRLLYEAVTEYVREGYNQAMREKRSYIGFLMILMQRLVVSSTSAIRSTLERRLEALEAPQEQLTLFPMYSDDDWADLDGQEQIETLLTTRLKALKNERAEVKLLIEAATRCQQAGADVKAEALLGRLYRLQADEGDPELKLLVFTEFVPTQQMLQAGRQLSFNLGEIFPNLSYPVVTALDRGDLDALYGAQKRHAPGVLGDNATKEFILRHVFEIAPELIRKPSDLLRVLLRRHYRRQRIPAILDERFVQVLRQNDGFEDWPLDIIIPDREAFFAFLQERWPVFLDWAAKQKGAGVCESNEAFGLEYPGPSDLPFDHDDIRVYIDNIFLEGLLHAVPADLPEPLSKTWLAIGIRTDEQVGRTRRVDGLLETIASAIPKEDTRHDDWFHFARTWAELVALALESDAVLSEPARRKIGTLQTQIDTALVAWLKKRYAGLINLPPVPPVMLHHIPRFLARYIGDAKEHKAAFLLVDGLALDQWIVLRKALVKQRPRYPAVLILTKEK